MQTGVIAHATAEAAKAAVASPLLPWLGPGTLLAAVVVGLVALIGHMVTRANATLQAKIAADSSELSAKISADNTRLQAEVSRQASELTNRISRENAQLSARLAANVKLADMRQAWINSLRNDMAEFQALAVTPGLEFQSEKEFYKMMARIELAMNPDDQDYTALSEALYAYINTDDISLIRANDAPFIAVCQRILKREWDVLKSEVRSVTADQDRDAAA